jgi:hypothetical protein
MIQYYDRNKENQISIEDFAIDLYVTLPIMFNEFGEDFVFIYTDDFTKEELKNIGIDVSRIFTPNPPETKSHTMRWLSILAIMTQPFQICPIGTTVKKIDDDYLTVETFSVIPFNPILAKYKIEQTGGLCGGDILSVNDNYTMLQAYIEARDIINNNDDITEQEVQVIMGSLLYKYCDKNKLRKYEKN